MNPVAGPGALGRSALVTTRAAAGWAAGSAAEPEARADAATSGRAVSVSTLPELVLTGSARVVLVNGRPVRLSRGEARLLAALAQCPGLPVHRCVLGHAAWPAPGSVARVSVAVQRLRRKIGRDRVLTVYGQGYQLLPTRLVDQRPSAEQRR